MAFSGQRGQPILSGKDEARRCADPSWKMRKRGGHEGTQKSGSQHHHFANMWNHIF